MGLGALGYVILKMRFLGFGPSTLLLFQACSSSVHLPHSGTRWCGLVKVHVVVFQERLCLMLTVGVARPLQRPLSQLKVEILFLFCFSFSRQLETLFTSKGYENLYSVGLLGQRYIESLFPFLLSQKTTKLLALNREEQGQAAELEIV